MSDPGSAPAEVVGPGAGMGTDQVSTATEWEQHATAAQPRRRGYARRRPLTTGPTALYTFPTGIYARRVKPAVDRVAGAVLVLLALPLLLGVALAVRLSMGKGVIFRQERVGLGGRRFSVYKFRTMRHDRRRRHQTVIHDRRRTHKTVADPRHTPVGRFLRKWSLDELPQLLNVVMGDMSLIGPRPELVEVVDRYEPWQHRRHSVKPGLAGLWQIRHRGDGLMHEHVETDVEYVATISAWNDVKIALGTVPAALRRTGS